MGSLDGIYRKERGKILAWVRSKVADPEEAEDLLQESFLAAVTELDSAGTIEYLLAYVYSVLRNKVGDWYRSKKASRYSFSDIEKEFSMEEVLPDQSAGPEREFYQNLLMEELSFALEELPSEQRSAFVSNVFEGKSFREISEATGVPEGTLSARKSYAKDFLAKRMKDLKTLFLEEF
ncbi:sigma-70 family RNA polymerase sigma factor [Leptospira wolffii]|uniref:RNA polymerase sigma factor n=1 Tax=Leptospira wolffii TaxID=409998 RepID=UPI00108485D6|nr:sigma-70 family RNA polymerase sigma factor [Leptospira wolffii]TGK62082.1 sigma-70 family RNA polymerase sigma factor [Leptospira wolffii]TGK68684.1 sigma-70 family RNA polymerase sigma factor [Leptospira wolffii]TGK74532.1 sigma-70 family RNA polymerase sigma factor [Leptospira wolffii]TGL31892.1 sigma-70 family RNA polymerase sigma factor [Leptospira wolffii]